MNKIIRVLTKCRTGTGNKSYFPVSSPFVGAARRLVWRRTDRHMAWQSLARSLAMPTLLKRDSFSPRERARAQCQGFDFRHPSLSRRIIFSLPPSLPPSAVSCRSRIRPPRGTRHDHLFAATPPNAFPFCCGVIKLRLKQYLWRRSSWLETNCLIHEPPNFLDKMQFDVLQTSDGLES